MTVSDGLITIQLAIGGLAIGSIYSLIALGFVIIYNAVGLVSFAQGEFVMAAALLGLTLLTAVFPATASSSGFMFLLPYSVVLIAMAAFGIIFYIVSYRPLAKRGWMPFVISTIGFSIVIKNGAQLIWGSAPQIFPSPVEQLVIQIGQLRLRTQDLVIISGTTICIAALWLLFQKSSLGRQMMAVAQDRDTARLLGLRVGRVVALTFVLSAVLAGIAGLLVAPIFTVSKDMGGLLALKAFAATITGGFGSLKGCVVGGLLIGLAETLGAFYISLEYSDAIAFVVLIAVLLFKPSGIFGESFSEKV